MGDLHDANVDTSSNFKSVNLKKGDLNYSASCKEYSETYGCMQIELNINNTLITIAEQRTEGAEYLMVKNNNIVLAKFGNNCGEIEIYRNSKLIYTIDKVNINNDTLSNYLKSKNKPANEEDQVRYANNKLYYLVNTKDRYTILKSIDLTKDVIKEDEHAMVKNTSFADCYEYY